MWDICFGSGVRGGGWENAWKRGPSCIIGVRVRSLQDRQQGIDKTPEGHGTSSSTTATTTRRFSLRAILSLLSATGRSWPWPTGRIILHTHRIIRGGCGGNTCITLCSPRMETVRFHSPMTVLAPATSATLWQQYTVAHACPRAHHGAASHLCAGTPSPNRYSATDVALSTDSFTIERALSR